MSTAAIVVRPIAGRLETLSLLLAISIILALGSVFVVYRQQHGTEVVIADWQLSGFLDLQPADMAIYTALHPSSEEIFYLHQDMLAFREKPDDPVWPTIGQLEEYLMPPFVKDLSWEQTGRLTWELAAIFVKEGETVYWGHGGTVPGQGSYLLKIGHIHTGATAASPQTIWLNPDPNAPLPSTYKSSSLILEGWKQVVPYSGRDELERLKGKIKS